MVDLPGDCVRPGGVPASDGSKPEAAQFRVFPVGWSGWEPDVTAGVLEWNPAAEALFGWSREVIGTDLAAE